MLVSNMRTDPWRCKLVSSTLRSAPGRDKNRFSRSPKTAPSPPTWAMSRNARLARRIVASRPITTKASGRRSTKSSNVACSAFGAGIWAPLAGASCTRNTGPRSLVMSDARTSHAARSGPRCSSTPGARPDGARAVASPGTVRVRLRPYPAEYPGLVPAQGHGSRRDWPR